MYIFLSSKWRAVRGGKGGMYIYSDELQKTYIFRWHNFFELIQSEFFFSFTNILSENLFQPLYILFVKNSTHPRYYIQLFYID